MKPPGLQGSEASFRTSADSDLISIHGNYSGVSAFGKYDSSSPLQCSYSRDLTGEEGRGGFRHGQHLAFDTAQNYPLPNLFVSMLQRMGLDEDKFASSTGTMRGLEMT